MAGAPQVPGEMFRLALAARASDMGVVGSTQNILDFVLARTREALQRPQAAERLRFVLGTETGMVTSIVDAVQRLLRAAPAAAPRVEVEIIFPVSSDAIAIPARGGPGQPAAVRPPAAISALPLPPPPSRPAALCACAPRGAAPDAAAACAPTEAA